MNIDIQIGYWVLVAVLVLLIAHFADVNATLTDGITQCYNSTTTIIESNLTAWQW